MSQADFPDFNDVVKLRSGKEMVDRLTNLIAIFENKAENQVETELEVVEATTAGAFRPDTRRSPL